MNITELTKSIGFHDFSSIMDLCAPCVQTWYGEIRAEVLVDYKGRIQMELKRSII